MKKLLKVTVLTGILTFIKMLIGFIIVKIVAMYSGPIGIATLGQLQSVIVSLNGIINAPVSSGIVRYTAECHSKGYKECSPWWTASIYWTIAILAIILPLSFLVSKPLSNWLFNNQEYYWLIIVAAFFLPLTAAGTLINSIINGQQMYGRYIALGMVSTLISSAILIILIIYENLIGALVGIALQNGIIGIVMLLTNMRQSWFKLEYLWGNCSYKHIKLIGGYILMAITSALALPISLIIIRSLLISNVGWELTGQWQAVWKISEAYLAIITMALATYYLPRLSVLNTVSEIRYEINSVCKIVMPIVIFLAFSVYITRDIIITVLFTEEFRGARDLFLIQLLGDIVKVASWLYAYPMLSRGATKWFVTIEISFSFSFIFFVFLFVHIYGVSGANIAYLFNYILYFIFVFVKLPKILR